MHSLFVSATDAAGHTRSLMRNYRGAGEDLVVALPEGNPNLEATRVTTGVTVRTQNRPRVGGAVRLLLARTHHRCVRGS